MFLLVLFRLTKMAISISRIPQPAICWGTNTLHTSTKSLKSTENCIQQPDKKPISVAHLFENTVTLIKSEPANEHVQILWEVKPMDLEIVADKKQVAQVLINLLKNSVEALKNQDGGKIVLKAEINKNDRIFISVTDNGPGIPEDLMDKIFIPFFTTKENGSGIGLSLSRQIMQMHGGSMKVESNQQKTTFTILF